MGAADDVGADPGVVEVEEGVLVDDEVAAAGPVLELLGLLEQPPVLGEEPVPGVPLAVDERVPDEELAGERRGRSCRSCTSRSATSGTPYSVTRSWAITAARFFDQCGSE